jgi:replication-associated recombination protein RarA
MISERLSMNMVFHGPSGAGKSSSARLILNLLGPENGFEVHGSIADQVDIACQIKQQVASSPFVPGKKICFIDDADLVPKQVQRSLSAIIENNKRSRFLFTANEQKKIVSQIHSRMLPISFEIAPADQGEVKGRVLQRVIGVLTTSNTPHDQARLEQIVEEHFPDLRAAANSIEWEFGAVLSRVLPIKQEVVL